jgi:protein-disulfide isomerase
MNKKILFISASLIILLAFIGAATIFKANNSQQSAKVENLDIIERVGAPIKGPLEAKVTIVEFFDPACETCSAFYPLVIKRYPGKVKVMMRYTPFHKGSDQVVKLLEAAHLQEQFWPAVEILFDKQQAWTRHHVAQPQSARALLKDLPLDSAQFMRDVSSENVSKVIMRDIADGKTLEVRATPQFFVNGKPLVNFGYEQLTQLVEEAIAEAY